MCASHLYNINHLFGMKETGFNIEFIGELGNVMMPALQGNKY